MDRLLLFGLPVLAFMVWFALEEYVRYREAQAWQKRNDQDRRA